MSEHRSSLQGWMRFAGIVLVVAVLYWAQAVLIPVCLAILLTFVLTPPVADDSVNTLMEAGASQVSSTLLAARSYLGELAHVGIAAVPAADSDAA